MQDTPASKNEGAARDNFQQAIDHYAPIVGAAKARGKLLAVTAVVVANLCVAYIMNERNHEAEDLMKQLEREEELSGEAEPDKRVRRLPRDWHVHRLHCTCLVHSNEASTATCMCVMQHPTHRIEGG